MPKSLTHRARFFLAVAVLGIVAAVIFGFWAFELRQTIRTHQEREEELLVRYQQRQLEAKAEGLRDLFAEFYQTGRTISLLPAVRDQAGGNRRDPSRHPVELGRMSLDTHRTLQQLYMSLATYVRISEIYYVLDGFAPERGEVPFFTYDDAIAGRAGHEPNVGRTPEVEEHEYAYFLKQLEWFRKNAPQFRFDQNLRAIPVLISPLMRTCDNTQFGTAQDDPRNVLGFIHAMPVYDTARNRFKGMIATIVRANQLEAWLLGVPFLPLSEGERNQAAREGWKMPAAPSHFVLTESRYGIEIADRRNGLFAAGLALAKAKGEGRWASLTVELQTDGRWTLHHHLTPGEAENLLREAHLARNFAVGGRFALLGVLAALFGWGGWLFRASRRELMWMAHYDPLTELPNRRLFFDRLQAALARARRGNTRVGLFYVDVADLNAVNDTFGHHAGDQLLVELATRFRKLLRGSDTLYRGRRDRLTGWRDLLPVVSRLGGDEFTILCEDVKSEDGLLAIAERILAAVREPFSVDGNPVEVRLNVGVAVFPDDADEADGGERLLMCADSAMNECKQNRSAGFVMFNEKTRARIERQHSLALELQSALSRRQFELYYQPKASLVDGRIVSLEGLLRWKHPGFGTVSPGEFIPILERSGAIIEVGDWVVEQGCRDLIHLSESGFPELRVSVNVSIRQLRRGDFHDTVASILSRFGIEPDRLILEITESMVMEDLAQGRRTLERLRELGVGLAIDDFGTGYSSLTYLQHLPINCLKLDKGLIDGMVDARSTHVVESVIRLAQGLSLKTIAEGIETEVQREHLAAMGCDQIQGYLLSEPKPLAEMIDWLTERERARLAY